MMSANDNNNDDKNHTLLLLLPSNNNNTNHNHNNNIQIVTLNNNRSDQTNLNRNQINRNNHNTTTTTAITTAAIKQPPDNNNDAVEKVILYQDKNFESEKMLNDNNNGGGDLNNNQKNNTKNEFARTASFYEQFDLENHRKAVFIQILMSIMANLTVFSSGMGLGYPAITFHSLTHPPDDPMSLTNDQASWFASINAITCPLGGLLCSYILDVFGRKRTLYTINAVSILSWGLGATASTTNRQAMFIQLLISRLLIGIATGLSSSPACVYSTEIAYPKLRGRLIVLTGMSIATGILIIYTLGYFIPVNWRLVSGICCIFCICSTIILIPIPETPSWLASKGRTYDAELSFRKFRGLPKTGSITNAKLREELEVLLEQSHSQNMLKRGDADTLWQKLQKPEIYKPLGIMIGFFACQQFSGIFVVVVYAVKVSQSAGVAIDPFLCVVFIGITRVVACVIVGYVLDKWGRRRPAMFSGALMALCMFGMAVSVYDGSPIGDITWLPLFLILSYIFTSTLGLLTIPFSMIAEIYPQKIRGFASGITICAAYTMCFIIVKLYPMMMDEFGSSFVFVFFGAVSFLSIFYVYFVLPETKGKTLLEIENMFLVGKKKTNHDGIIIKTINGNVGDHDHDMEKETIKIEK